MGYLGQSGGTAVVVIDGDLFICRESLPPFAGNCSKSSQINTGLALQKCW
jgi:hypothetical protein